MPQEIHLVLSPQEAADISTIRRIASVQSKIADADLSEVRIRRKSIDARGKNIKVLLTVLCYTSTELVDPVIDEYKFQNVANKPAVIIVGSGPSGLFAALELIERGLKPIIIERGKKVEERHKDIVLLEDDNCFDPESNYCFGEGGAGTFSDGKLYTRSKKKGNHRKVLELLYKHGAKEDILFDAHPHIGSDSLPNIIAAIRKTIIDCGGELYFNQKVTQLKITNDKIAQVQTASGDTFEGIAYIFATGHSAHDIYYMLHHGGVELQAKAFALGVRAEHPQELINEIQYGKWAKTNYLPNASYSLVQQVDNRGVYSFCMCPGGQIVPSATTENSLVVNGMSNANRNSAFANSGIVVEIKEEDLPGNLEDPLRGLKFQQRLEQSAFKEVSNGNFAPAQNLLDFVNGKSTTNLPPHSYKPGLVASDLHNWLPPSIGERLQKGFQLFNAKMRGYLTSEALIAGVESRSSSPVRIPRDRLALHHIRVHNLYPSGEGAGYAGGIVSSAVDGMRCAEAIATSNLVK